MRRWTVVVLAAVLLAAACEDASGPAGGLDNEDATAVAVETDALVGAMLENALLAVGFGSDGALALFDVRPFERTRECPAGGVVRVSGEVERTRNDEGVAEWSLEGAGEWDECRHARRNDLTITINGSFEFEAFRRRVNGHFAGEQTTHRSGSFVWERSDGRSGECEFDVTSVRDPESQTRTVTGVICGREIDRTVSWGRTG